jgi:hypothetical protein
MIQFAGKRLIVSHSHVRLLELLDRRDERLRHEATPELAKIPASVRIASGDD